MGYLESMNWWSETAENDRNLSPKNLHNLDTLENLESQALSIAGARCGLNLAPYALQKLIPSIGHVNDKKRTDISKSQKWFLFHLCLA